MRYDSDVILSMHELQLLTNYCHPCKQLEVLKSRGFHRAYVGRKGRVVLERQHYEAVCRGESGGIRRDVNLAFLRRDT